MHTTLQKILNITRDHDEIECILSGLYANAKCNGDDNIVYANTVTATYETTALGKRTITDLVFHKDEESESFKILQYFNSVYQGAGKETYKIAALSNYKVIGRFEVDGEISISELPAGNPVPGELWAKHAFVVEIRINQCADHSVNSVRRSRILDDFELLFTALVSPIECQYGKSAEKCWVYECAEDGTMTSKWRQCGYTATALNSNTGNLPQIPEIDDDVFYKDDFHSVDSNLMIPKSFKALYTTALNLKHNERRMLFSALRCYKNGLDSFHQSKGLSVISLTTAIECLIDQRDNSIKCSQCNREMDDGPTKKFAAFMEAFCPGLDSATRAKFYKIRSNLAHGKMTLLGDTPSYSFNPVSVHQGHLVRTMVNCVRISIRNWIAQKSRDRG